MFVVSLLTNPAFGLLDPSWPENLRNAWGGGDVRWLSPDIAAEFELATRPANFDAVRVVAGASSIDLNILPKSGRRKALLLADMDSTMIGQECIDELAEVAGVGEQVRDVTARAMNGELDFEKALGARLSLMKGLPVNIIDDVLRSRISLSAGGPVLVATMKANGAYAALVSGGFTTFSGPVAKALGFDEHQSNVLGQAGGLLTGEVEGPILGREAKVEALNRLCSQLSISPSDVLAVGDGANDLEMLGAAGAGVAMHAKPVVAAECDLQINHGDLTAILYLQRYSLTDFVDVDPCPLFG